MLGWLYFTAVIRNPQVQTYIYRIENTQINLSYRFSDHRIDPSTLYKCRIISAALFLTKLWTVLLIHNICWKGLHFVALNTTLERTTYLDYHNVNTNLHKLWNVSWKPLNVAHWIDAFNLVKIILLSLHSLLY